MKRHAFDAEKAVEVILYVAASYPNFYTTLKILYFADREHLSRYGRLICGDSYVAMSSGPVPSGAYDMIKYARGDGFCAAEALVDAAFEVQGYRISSRRDVNLDFLSESDTECLDYAIEKYGPLTPRELKQRSHDAAYEAAEPDDFIPLEALVKSLPNGDSVLDYLEKN